MTRGVKGTGTKPSVKKEEPKVEQPEQTGEKYRCQSCISNRNWNHISPVVIADKEGKMDVRHLHQCGFCKRIVVTKSEEIPRSNNPLDRI